MSAKKLFLLFVIALTSCLKESSPPFQVDFEYTFINENQTEPCQIQLINKCLGTDFYKWSFEGANIESSDEKTPKIIKFDKAGTYKISLNAWNNIEQGTKEIKIRIDSIVSIDFNYDIKINNYAPAEIEFFNKTQGALSYQWSFEGATVFSSQEKEPGVITFPTGGEHKVKLVAFNGSKYFELEKTIVLKPALKADFIFEPSFVDMDMEAPLKATLINKTQGGSSFIWECEGAEIQNDKAENQTIISFENPGTYKIKLSAENGKYSQGIEKEFVIKENSGIYIFKNILFSIVDAKNSVGNFFSSDLRRVLKENELSFENQGGKVDLGFFCPDNKFKHFYFFSPEKASDIGFENIENPRKTIILNVPKNQNVNFSENDFNNILTKQNFETLKFSSGIYQDFLTKENYNPVLFQTHNGKKGAIKIVDFVESENISDCYIITEIKIEKGIGE